MSSLIGVHEKVDERVFLTKAGDVLTVLKVEGVDPECLGANQLTGITTRFERALAVLSSSFRLYQYLFKRDQVDIKTQDYTEPALRNATVSRTEYFRGKADQLFTFEIFFVLSYEDWLRPNTLSRLTKLRSLKNGNTFLGSLSAKRQAARIETDVLQAAYVLRNRADSFLTHLDGIVGVRAASEEESLELFRRLMDPPDRHAAPELASDNCLDQQLCRSTIECYRDHLAISRTRLEILTLKEPPASTFAGLMQGFENIPSDCVVATEWKRIDNSTMRRRITSQRRHHHNLKISLTSSLGPEPTSARQLLVDDSKEALVNELGGCLEELDVKGNYFGEYSASIVLSDENLPRLKKSVAECHKLFSLQTALLTEERYNLVNAFTAVQPGNRAHNLRRLWLLNTNAADLALVWKPSIGQPVDAHLGMECLSVFETNQHTPYYFSLHENDLGHTLVIGATGSGKSFTVNFLATHAQKYLPYTCLFDLGGSYRSLTRLMGGSYIEVAPTNRRVTINPFALPNTVENLQFLTSFVRVLLEGSNQYRSTAVDDVEIYNQISNLYAIAPPERRLSTLTAILPKSLAVYLQKWTGEGQYAEWFDNPIDNLTVSRFQTFDFEGLEKTPDLLEPVLFYILHRANAVIYDRSLTSTLKLFVLDEAWRFLQNKTIHAYVKEALKTWRKKNASVVLATQSVDDLDHSQMMTLVNESCPTKLFLANPDADYQGYASTFHLNETEAELLRKLTPKRQLLLKRPSGSKILNLEVDSTSYWLYTNSPLDNVKRQAIFEQHGFEDGLKILTRSSS